MRTGGDWLAGASPLMIAEVAPGMTVLQPELVENGAGRNCERLGEPDCSRPHHVGSFWLCDMIVALFAVHPAACLGRNITARLSSCQTPATVRVSETRGLLTFAFQLSITTVIVLISADRLVAALLAGVCTVLR